MDVGVLCRRDVIVQFKSVDPSLHNPHSNLALGLTHILCSGQGRVPSCWRIFHRVTSIWTRFIDFLVSALALVLVLSTSHFAMPQSSVPAPEPLPFIYTFAAGATAGVTELLCLYPLDVVKTRIQLQGKIPIPGQESYNGMVDCFQKIIKTEGFGRLYRGLVPPLMLEAPKRAVKFAANDFWGKTFKELTGAEKLNQNLSLLTGMSAGATESVVVVPFELVKIRLQDRNSTYKGPWDVVLKTIKTQGILGLYGGLESTFWRHVWWNGGYFASIFKVKALMPKSESKGREILNNFISGSIGGFIGTALNTPFDVVKSRIQNAVSVPGQTPKYGWTYPAILTIAKEEGVSALYKGFLPKVLRLAPGGGVLLVVVEVVTGFFRRQLGPPYLLA
ncbi:hypothetical protein O181_020090 [Austropuccinia psidii MF-1]|uniref:Mitochondrial 2-oxodicarboxylate carrier n=1 Tax=Austropuccinia psidii MF-1 TaxID=1389203 RepID=A0A9Q3CD36_9BASI|nr:hypothetical protein [Austropuccinia psidii MF-1]